MTPDQAAALRGEVDVAAEQARRLVEGMDAGALMKRPGSGAWSVGENLQHLILTSNAMLPLAEAAVAQVEREQRKAAKPAGLGFIGWLLFKSLDPPARMKIKTTKPFEPVEVKDPLTLLDRLNAGDAKLKSLIDRASGLDTASVKVTSPFNEKAKYNLYAAFRIMLAHERRHLWAAERAKSGS
jgi:hypothetical protein